MADDRVLSAGPGCRVPVEQVRWRFGPSGGPGGQHANRAHTRVEAELDLTSARGIDDEVRARLVARLGDTVSPVYGVLPMDTPLDAILARIES